MEKIMETLQAAVIEVLQCDISELQPETSFEKDLGADSLDAYQILIHVQDELGIELPLEKVEEIKTLADACRLISDTMEQSGKDGADQ